MSVLFSFFVEDQKLTLQVTYEGWQRILNVVCQFLQTNIISNSTCKQCNYSFVCVCVFVCMHFLTWLSVLCKNGVPILSAMCL